MRIGSVFSSTLLACRPFFLKTFRSDLWFSSTLLACHPFFLRTCRSARWFSSTFITCKMSPILSEFISIGSVVLIDIHRMPYMSPIGGSHQRYPKRNNTPPSSAHHIAEHRAAIRPSLTQPIQVSGHDTA
jgi:hypothetical protein